VTVARQKAGRSAPAMPTEEPRLCALGLRVGAAQGRGQWCYSGVNRQVIVGNRAPRARVANMGRLHPAVGTRYEWERRACGDTWCRMGTGNVRRGSAHLMYSDC